VSAAVPKAAASASMTMCAQCALPQLTEQQAAQELELLGCGALEERREHGGAARFGTRTPDALQIFERRIDVREPQRCRARAR
jgi:hypothetical protein